MAQTGYTPIITYHSNTAAAVPSASNLAEGELAVNVTDKKIFTKDNGGSVVQIGSSPSTTDTLTNKTLALGSNTVSGTKAQFDTACTDGNFVYQSDVGVSVAGLASTQTFTAPQRGTVTTDNDLSFDLSVTNYFACTPTAGGTLTFTNIPTGQPVAIKLVNGSNYAIAAHANTKISAADLTRISTTGTYLLTGLADGTNVLLTASANLA